MCTLIFLTFIKYEILINDFKSTDDFFQNNTVEQKRKMERKERLVFLAKLNKLKSAACPVYGEDVQNLVSILPTSNQPVQSLRHADQPWSVSGSVNVSNAIAFRGLSRKSFWSRTTKLENLVRTPEELAHELTDILTRYDVLFYIMPLCPLKSSLC